jgi:hypothetical protein
MLIKNIENKNLTMNVALQRMITIKEDNDKRQIYTERRIKNKS